MNIRLKKVQVCAMFRAGDIRNVLLKFIRLCMETHVCVPPNKSLFSLPSQLHLGSTDSPPITSRIS